MRVGRVRVGRMRMMWVMAVPIDAGPVDLRVLRPTCRHEVGIWTIILPDPADRSAALIVARGGS